MNISNSSSVIERALLQQTSGLTLMNNTGTSQVLPELLKIGECATNKSGCDIPEAIVRATLQIGVPVVATAFGVPPTVSVPVSSLAARYVSKPLASAVRQVGSFVTDLF